MQQKSWCEQQGAMKAGKQHMERLNDKAYEALQAAQLEHQHATATAESDARRAQMKEIAVHNQALAEEKAQQRQQDKMDEQEANRLEQYNTFNSCLMAEH